MLAKCRRFFSDRGILEVDCPILGKEAVVDAHIDLIPATYGGKQSCYLHSSPEAGMKRLLAEGIGDIYQLSHVFRDGELGPKHNPEFMMAEWYRTGLAFGEMIDETCDFIRLFLGSMPQETLTYRQAFLEYAGIDPNNASEKQLRDLVPAHSGVQTRDDLLNIVLGLKVEPRLGQNKLTVITDYPPSQAALAKVENGTARRFEVYCEALELANGYDELADARAQEQRFVEANELRKKMGKKTLPVDRNFLNALKNGLPPCCGVAVGFDRLMMLRLGKNEIDEIVPFPLSIAAN